LQKKPNNKSWQWFIMFILEGRKEVEGDKGSDYPQSSSTLWNYSKCGVYTVESEAGC
jgi:hypothetical protein